MQCTNPENYFPNGQLNARKWPCGKCLACELNKQAEWATRLMLERRCHDTAIFFTLTYDQEHCPEQLSKRHVQLFVKRWRKNYGTQPRYFICAEYGSKHGRPHYHGIFFGEKMMPVRRIARRSLRSMYVTVDPRIEDTWGLGSTYSKACDSSTAGVNITRYIAAYVVKNALNANGTESKAEWALQSRHPYIGFPAVKHLSAACTTRTGSVLCSMLGTVPGIVKSAGRRMKIPLKIRQAMAYELGYPCLPVPPTDGTIIDYDGKAIQKEATIKPRDIRQALAAEDRIRSKLKAKAFRCITRNAG